MTPLVSIVVPVYNQAHYLAACLESLLRQTLREWEAVVVDDRSTEGDPAGVLRAVCDPRIVLVSHERNRGLAAARNTGIRSTGCAWFLPLDADDELDPAFLETVLSAAEKHPECDAIFTDFLWFGAQHGVMRYRAQDLAAFVRDRAMPGPGVLTRRTVWERAGGYCEAAPLRISCEDWDFWITALEQGVKAHHVGAPLYRYRRHAESTMARGSPDYHRARELIYRRHPAAFDAHGAAGLFLAEGYWRSAYQRLAAGRRATALILAMRATVAGGDLECLLRFFGQFSPARHATLRA